MGFFDWFKKERAGAERASPSRSNDDPRWERFDQLQQRFRDAPRDVRVLHELSTLAMELQDWKTAQRTLRALLLQRLDEGEGVGKAEVFLRLAQVHEALGEDAKAKAMLQRAADLEARDDQDPQ